MTLAGEAKQQLDRISELLEVNVDDEGYRNVFDRMTEARALFHNLLARQFAPALNAHLALLPQNDRSDKQRIARSINADLKSLGLAAKAPDTGEAATLHADWCTRSDKGRFQWVALKDRRRTASMPVLSDLQLTMRPERREPFAEYWARRISDESPEDRQRG